MIVSLLIGHFARAQTTYLKASNSESSDQFGTAVAVSGDTMVVGALFESGGGTGVNPASDETASSAGAAYVYERVGGVWTFKAYLKASNTGENDNFGRSVAIDGDTIVVGAPEESGSGTGVNPPDDDDLVSAGAAYVFVRSGGEWSQQAYLKAENPWEYSNFGLSVAVSGETVVVGAPKEDGIGIGVNPTIDESGDDSGAAYVFTRSGGVWSQTAYVKASNTGDYDEFGSAVAVTGDVLVVGAPFESGSGQGINPLDDDDGFNVGAAYVYRRAAGVWAFEAYVKASNAGDGDQFGLSVAAAGETFVAGAPEEDSSGEGVNPVPDNSANQSGAAYVFAHHEGNWSEQAMLKASNTGAADYFGTAVAVFGDRVLVGAFDEDGDGADLDPLNNNLSSGSGAAYLFRRAAGVWSQGHYIKAPNTGSGDSFGQSVAVSSSTLGIGAPFEEGDGAGVDPVENDGAFFAGAAYVLTDANGGGGTPAISIAGDADFGRIVLPGAETRFFTISNTGTADLSVSSITAGGDAVITNVVPAVEASTLYALGSNGSGQLGIGNGVFQDDPVQVSNIDNALEARVLTALAGGNQHTLALSSTGEVLAWGLNGQGQVGDGSGPNRMSPVLVTTAGTPLASTHATKIAAGGFFSMALTAGGRVVTWGSNLSGAIGDGTNTNRSVPTAVVTTGTPLSGKAVADIAAGGHHAMALTQDGTVVCWGLNDSGQTGLDPEFFTESTLPVGVSVDTHSNGGRRVVATAAGDRHSLVLYNNGTMQAWGRNAFGTLGTGSTLDSFTPANVAVPVSPANGKFVIRIAAGTHHNLALCADGTLYAWGDNEFGQIGDGTSATMRTSPVPVIISGTPLQGRFITQIAAIGSQSLALCTDGTIVWWGKYTGDGVTDPESHVPVLLNNLSPGPGNKPVIISRGALAGHTHIGVGGTAPPAVSHFYVQSAAPFVLAAGGSFDLAVAFLPAAAGAYSGTVTVTSDAPDSPSLVNLVGSANSLPSHAGNTLQTAQAQSVSFHEAKVLGRAGDADGQSLAITAMDATSAQGGTVSRSGGVITYTPLGAYTGTDSFTFEISDGADVVTGLVTITITADTGLNGANPPVLTPLEGGAVSITNRGIPGRVYGIQRSTDLTNWTQIGAATAAADGTVMVSDPAPPMPTAFYRIIFPAE